MQSTHPSFVLECGPYLVQLVLERPCTSASQAILLHGLQSDAPDIRYPENGLVGQWLSDSREDVRLVLLVGLAGVHSRRIVLDTPDELEHERQHSVQLLLLAPQHVVTMLAHHASLFSLVHVGHVGVDAREFVHLHHMREVSFQTIAKNDPGQHRERQFASLLVENRD